MSIFDAINQGAIGDYLQQQQAPQPNWQIPSPAMQQAAPTQRPAYMQQAARPSIFERINQGMIGPPQQAMPRGPSANMPQLPINGKFGGPPMGGSPGYFNQPPQPGFPPPTGKPGMPPVNPGALNGMRPQIGSGVINPNFQSMRDVADRSRVQFSPNNAGAYGPASYGGIFNRNMRPY